MLYAFLILLLVMVLYLAGAKVSIDTSYTVPELPNDLDDYLAKAEARFDDVTPGAEKTIHWADPANKTRTPIAFVYFHGFSATRQEAMPVPELVARHFNCNIYYARLAGNGRSDDAMAIGSVNGWVNDASEALAIAREIGDRTIIIATSTGASLSWWAACQADFQDQIESMIFFSPNFGLADTRDRLLTIRWGRQLAECVLGKYRENENAPVSPAHKKYWTLRYPTRALLPMMGLVKVARKIKPSHWNKPMFIVYSPYDDTISAAKVQKFYQKLTCRKRILEIDDPKALSQHVIVGDILAPQNTGRVTDAVIEFIEQDVLESRVG